MQVVPQEHTTKDFDETWGRCIDRKAETEGIIELSNVKKRGKYT